MQSDAGVSPVVPAGASALVASSFGIAVERIT
jgi:hypothetical protein